MKHHNSLRVNNHTGLLVNIGLRINQAQIPKFDMLWNLKLNPNALTYPSPNNPKVHLPFMSRNEFMNYIISQIFFISISKQAWKNFCLSKQILK